MWRSGLIKKTIGNRAIGLWALSFPMERKVWQAQGKIRPGRRESKDFHSLGKKGEQKLRKTYTLLMSYYCTPKHVYPQINSGERIGNNRKKCGKVSQMSSAGGGFKSYVSLSSLTVHSCHWRFIPTSSALAPVVLYMLFSHTHFQPSCNLITPHLGLVKALGFIWPHWFPMFTAGFLQCEQWALWRSCAERIVV